MNPEELRSLRLIAIFFVGIAAFLAATGRWASAGAVLVLLLVFSAIVVWRSKRFDSFSAEPKEGEVRTRRMIARALPVLLVFGLYLNRRRLAEIQMGSEL